jgi:hypothetical protein
VLDAAKAELGDDYEVELIIKDLSNETMIRLMADENTESSGRKFIHDIEVVRSVVQAYARGEIDMDVDPKTRDNQKRYAPSFVMGDVHGGRHAHHPYTATEITEFLGWPKNNAGERSSTNDRVAVALGALELNEQGHLNLEQFRDGPPGLVVRPGCRPHP